MRPLNQFTRFQVILVCFAWTFVLPILVVSGWAFASDVAVVGFDLTPPRAIGVLAVLIVPPIAFAMIWHRQRGADT